MPRVAGAVHSANGMSNFITISITPILHRAGHSRLFIDRPGGGIFFYRISKILPAAALVMKGHVPMNAYAVRRLLRPTIRFIYGYRNPVLPRVSRAEEISPYDNGISKDNGILVPYLAASERLACQGGGISFSSTQVKHSAAAHFSINLDVE